MRLRINSIFVCDFYSKFLSKTCFMRDNNYAQRLQSSNDMTHGAERLRVACIRFRISRQLHQKMWPYNTKILTVFVSSTLYIIFIDENMLTVIRVFDIKIVSISYCFYIVDKCYVQLHLLKISSWQHCIS